MTLLTFTRFPGTQELNNETSHLAQCKYRVDKPIMIHEWNDLCFLHYSFEPEDIAKLLPEGLNVELIDGKAWVSIVPFKMHVEFPLVGTLPYFSDFPETNIRTYVTDQNGTRGIWFFSLDASRLLAVGGGRFGYRLGYFWSKMNIHKTDNRITYSSSRWFPGPRGAKLNATIEIGEPYKRDELTDLDHLLSAQWILFSKQFGEIYSACAEHKPWNIYKAKLIKIDESLLQAAGLPKPKSEPIVQFSPGARVNISLPTKVQTAISSRKIVFFDGECNLCNGYVQTILKLDRKNVFMFSSLQSPVAKKILKEFGREIDTSNLDTVVYLNGDKIYDRSSATIRMAKSLGWPFKLIVVLIVIPKPIRDFLYNAIAKRRYRIFGKRETCMVPTPELKNRFLD